MGDFLCKASQGRGADSQNPLFGQSQKKAAGVAHACRLIRVNITAMKPNQIRWVSLLLLVAALPLASSAQTSRRVTIPGINNFWVVDENVSTGGTITSREMAMPALKQRGIKTVIDLAGGDQSNAERAAAEAAGMRYLVFAINPTTLDPHKRTSLFDADVHTALYVGLVSNVIADTPTGALAESWTSPDAKSWTFKLRSGLTFHNGQPVTPDAIKFSMDRLIAPETGTSGALKARASQIASTTVVDPVTIRIDLKAANAAFPVDAADLMVVPQNFDAANPVQREPFETTAHELGLELQFEGAVGVSDLDTAIEAAVREWVATQWPFDRVTFEERDR